MYLNLDDFLTGITGGTADLDIGIGVVKVRALEFAEVQAIRHQAGDDDLMAALLTAMTGLVEPKLSREHLEQLNHARAGVIGTISRRILELSGMAEEAEKKVGTGS
jgi:hypothetical protein